MFSVVYHKLGPGKFSYIYEITDFRFQRNNVFNIYKTRFVVKTFAKNLCNVYISNGCTGILTSVTKQLVNNYKYSHELSQQ